MYDCLGSTRHSILVDNIPTLIGWIQTGLWFIGEAQLGKVGLKEVLGGLGEHRHPGHPLPLDLPDTMHSGKAVWPSPFIKV